MDTIFAVSSGRPPAGIAVIRISGPAALEAGRALAGTLGRPRQAVLRHFRDVTGSLLDEGLLLAFPGPKSATGDDLVELHCHGGRAVVAAVEAALATLPGLRRAEPGEFTRRALLNGRIDLAEAEGLADLLQAETEAQRVAAMGAASGRVSRVIEGWMDRLALLSAQIEAALDFADEDDVPADEGLLRQVRDGAGALAAEMDEVLKAPAVDRLRDGVAVVLAGPPNSGKSTLLNLLSEREVAIVSPIAGTTRDRIDASVAYHGVPYVLTDTAGLTDQTHDVIEAIGIERARSAVEHADVLLWLGDGEPPRANAIRVHARADLPGRENLPADRDLAVSRGEPASVAALWRLIAERASVLVPRPDQLALEETQRQAVRGALAALREGWTDPVIAAELIRSALVRLATVLGRNSTEAMLDALFGRFCIGK